jgi:hypothetical protein
MRTPLRSCFPLFALACLAATARAQGETGFLRGAGKTDVVLSWSLDSYDQFWIGTDKVSDPGVGEIDRETWTLYAAYGLTEDVDLIFSGSYVTAESDGTAGFPEESDLQDAVFAAKWRAWQAPFAGGDISFLFEPGVKLPMTDYEYDAVTAIGDGQVDLRVRGIVHWQNASGVFASLESGYDIRNGPPEDEVPLNLTLGVTVFERLTLTPFYSQVFSTGGVDISDLPAPGGFPATQEEYSRAGLGAYVRISENIGLTGLWRTTLDGRNTGDVDTFGVGLVGRF